MPTNTMVGKLQGVYRKVQWKKESNIRWSCGGGRSMSFLSKVLCNFLKTVCLLKFILRTFMLKIKDNHLGVQRSEKHTEERRN